MDILKKILDDVIKDPVSDPFSHFGLRNFKEKSVAEMEDLFENYEMELKKIFNHIQLLSEERSTIKIAMIGPSGSGKTTLLQYLIFRIEQFKEEAKYKDILDKINFTFGFYAKGAPDSLLKIQLDILKRGSGGLVVIDDIHEIFINEKSEVMEGYFKLLTSGTKNNILITTWLPYGWAYALSKYPELKNTFDDIIFIEGLDEKKCKKMIEKRFKKCSEINKSSEKIVYSPFTNKAINKIIRSGCPNPGIIISLLNNSVPVAYDNKVREITEKEIEIAANNLGKYLILKINKLTSLQQSIIDVCLLATTISIKDVKFLMKKKRPNVSKYMNDLTRMGFFKREKFENEAMFTMSPMFRYKIEENMMKEVEKLSKKK